MCILQYLSLRADYYKNQPVGNDNGLLHSVRNDAALCTITVKACGGKAAAGFYPIIAVSRHCEGIAQSNPNGIFNISN
jgi:hypothetical protein